MVLFFLKNKIGAKRTLLRRGSPCWTRTNGPACKMVALLASARISPFCQAPFASLPPPPAAVGFGPTAEPQCRWLFLSRHKRDAVFDVSFLAPPVGLEPTVQLAKWSSFSLPVEILPFAKRPSPPSLRHRRRSASGPPRNRSVVGLAAALAKNVLRFLRNEEEQGSVRMVLFFLKNKIRSKANFAPTWLPLLDSNQRSSLQNGRTARFRSHSSLLLSALRLPPSATGGGRLRAPAEPQCRWLFLSRHKRDAVFDVSFLAPPVGLEPTTLRLTAACSTN